MYFTKYSVGFIADRRQRITSWKNITSDNYQKLTNRHDFRHFTAYLCRLGDWHARQFCYYHSDLASENLFETLRN